MSYLDPKLVVEKPTKEQLEHVLDGFSKPIPPNTREQVADCIDRYYVMQRSSARIPSDDQSPLREFRKELKSFLDREAFFDRWMLSAEALYFFTLNAPEHLSDDLDIATYFLEDFKASRGRERKIGLARGFLFSQLRTILEKSGIKVGRSFNDSDASPKGNGLILVRDIFQLLYKKTLSKYEFQGLVLEQDTKSYTRKVVIKSSI